MRAVRFGNPHSPFKALAADKESFSELNDASANHYGELVGMDRSIGTLRAKLREFRLADNTLLVFCSDNGGLPEIKPDTVGGLRGNKGSVYEGGLRVPGIMEWPAIIKPRITNYPACTMDLFPTVADILGLPDNVFVEPLDGISLKPILSADITERSQPMFFRFGPKLALIDNRFKLIGNDRSKDNYQLYDLVQDPHETQDLSKAKPDVFSRMKSALVDWSETVDASFAGHDYSEGQLLASDLESISWFDAPQYASYLPLWKDRWEFKLYLGKQEKANAKNPAD
ncbi:MAG TPA: sulfatase-like hydrolase/transferase [Pirellula sp.]|nr:sulfatase-like hydrolase/transferase [Pirellula sp.]